MSITTKECPALNLIKAKLQIAKRNYKFDESVANEIDEAIERYCIYPKPCGHREECRMLDNRLSDYLPLYIKIPKYRTKGYTGDWIPKLNLKSILGGLK